MSSDSVYTSEKIKALLLSKKIKQIDNTKQKSDIWKDFTLLAEDSDGDMVVIKEWAACRYCFIGFRTHKEGKNLGSSHMQRHALQCESKARTSGNIVKQQPKQPVISNFAFVKKGLTPSQSEQLKMAELQFVINGQHSFNCVENDGLLTLAQQCVSIGNAAGNIKINDCWFGRRTIREKALAEVNQLNERILHDIAIPLQQSCVACTTDLWTDKYVKRSYLDFTLFWINETFQLKHTMARCKVFSHEKKTAENVRSELEGIMRELQLPLGDTPITTDAGSNIVAALTDEARYQCLAHRINTVLTDAWKSVKSNDPTFAEFDNAVHELIAYTSRSGGIQVSIFDIFNYNCILCSHVISTPLFFFRRTNYLEHCKKKVELALGGYFMVFTTVSMHPMTH